VYITRLFRLSLVLTISLGIICFVGVSIGASIPTTRIIAQVYSYEQDNQHMAIIDVNRNLPTYISFPIQSSGNISLSNNGQRLILPTSALNQATFSVWDIMMGRVVHLPEDYVNCSATAWRWLADNRHVLFQCRDNPQDGTIGGMYTLDFETGLVYLLYNQPTVILDAQWSVDVRRVGINDEGRIHIIGVQGDDFRTITPQGRRFTFIAWENGGESVLLRGVNTIERYTFATDELTVLLDDFETSILPVLSPNGEWLALVNNDRRPRAYGLNLNTGELHLLETNDVKINNTAWTGWSPDSQWVMIRTTRESIEGNMYYLARPDASAVLQLAQNIESTPVWSNDGAQISYSIYREMGNTYYAELLVWDLTSFLPAQVVMEYAQSPVWSPDGEGIAFIHYPQPQQLGYLQKNGQTRFLTDDTESVVGFAFVK
jgi:Tol biopolymer transport system component